MNLEELLADSKLRAQYERTLALDQISEDKITQAVQEIRSPRLVKRYLHHVETVAQHWQQQLNNPPGKWINEYVKYTFYGMDLPFYSRAFTRVEEEFSEQLAEIILAAQKGQLVSTLAYIFECPYNKKSGYLPHKRQRQKYFSVLHSLRSCHHEVIREIHFLLTSLIKNTEQEYPLDLIVAQIKELSEIGDEPFFGFGKNRITSVAQAYVQGLQFLAGPTFNPNFGTDLKLTDILTVENINLFYAKIQPLAIRYQAAYLRYQELWQLTAPLQTKKSPELIEAEDLSDKFREIVVGFASQLSLVLQLNPHALDDYVQTALAMYDHAPEIAEAGTIFRNFIGPHHHDYKLIATGLHSIIILSKGKVMKFASNIATEAALHLRLKRPKYVVKALEGYDPSLTLELEYIGDLTLQELLNNSGPLEPQTALKYGRNIFYGLLELRAAGIYHHRDIRPANIMIHQRSKRAVIIDLGIATTDKKAFSLDNRRYGSRSEHRANDLNSLGQVLYKMATGQHIFTNSQTMERTTYADSIRDQRDWIYSRPKERLKPYLEKLTSTVKDQLLVQLISFCLTARGSDQDYQILKKSFRDSER